MNVLKAIPRDQWIPDKSAQRCHDCAAAFNFLKRRHHCRRCGRIFCDGCSRHTFMMQEAGVEKQSRVCSACHTTLSQPPTGVTKNANHDPSINTDTSLPCDHEQNPRGQDETRIESTPPCPDDAPTVTDAVALGDEHAEGTPPPHATGQTVASDVVSRRLNTEAPNFRESVLVDIRRMDGPFSAVAAKCFECVVKCCEDLGVFMQLGRHHDLIKTLLPQRLAAIATDSTAVSYEACVAYVVLNNAVAARAFSVCLTTLEQSFHWPVSGAAPTPNTLERLKFVVHHGLHAELQECLLPLTPQLHSEADAEAWAHAAIENGQALVGCLEAGHRVTCTGDNLQRLINLLFRTVQQDVFYQQSAGGDNRRQMEFGSLYESVNTNGMMRLMNDVVDSHNAVSIAVELRDLLHRERHAPMSEPLSDADAEIAAAACNSMQRVVAEMEKVMANTRWDEAIWGMTYLRFAKAVSPSTMHGTGADTAAFHFLDAFIGCSRAEVLDANKENAGGKAEVLTEAHRSPTSRSPNRSPVPFGVCPNQSNEAKELSEVKKERLTYFTPEVAEYILSMLKRPPLQRLVSRHTKANFAYLALCQRYHRMLEMHRKKALSIVLALKAGGLPNTAANHIADDGMAMRVDRALRDSMLLRFGKPNPQTEEDGVPPTLPADAVILYPTVIEDESAVEGAVLSISFEGEVVVEVCDRVKISLTGLLEDERTFTVTSKPSPNTVEIAVKNFQTKLTLALCHATQPIPVHVRLAPDQHMRYTLLPPDAPDSEHVYFMAQGMAACAAIQWLYEMDRASRLCSGVYVLMCCSADWRTVPLKHRLDALCARNNPHFQLMILLTREKEGDEATLRARFPTAKYHKGRINTYVTGDVAKAIASSRGYVNGGSQFGINVARCLWTALPESDKRAGPIITPRSSRYKYDIYDNVSVRPDLKEVSMREVALHNKPNDAWVVVEDYVYDITSLMGFHPGGQKVLVQTLGLTATALFNTIHSTSREVRHMLRCCAVGQLPKSERSNVVATTPEEQEDQNILVAIADWVNIQNIATNSARCVAWPGNATGTDVPPVYFMTNSLRTCVAGVGNWGHQHLSFQDEEQRTSCGEAPTERIRLQEKIVALEASMHALDAKTVSYSGAVDMDGPGVPDAVAHIFASRAELWEKLHAPFDTAKEQLCACRSVAAMATPYLTFVEEATRVIGTHHV